MQLFHFFELHHLIDDSFLHKCLLALLSRVVFTLLQVKFHESKVTFENRFDKYLDPNFFHHRVSDVMNLIFYFFIIV